MKEREKAAGREAHPLLGFPYTGKKLREQNNLVSSSFYKKESHYSGTAQVAFSAGLERFLNSAHKRVTGLLCLQCDAC